MSVTAMAAVFEHSQATGAARLMMLAIADSAHDSGELSAYPRSQALLARKANVDARTARRALRALEDLGELKVTQVGDGRASSDYLMLLPGLKIEGGRDARPGRADRPAREGKVPAPSSRPSPSLPVNEKGSARSAAADGQGALPGVPTGAPKPPELLAAQELIRRVWTARNPRPATPFVALVKIAKRLIEAGHSEADVERAFMETPAFTTAALEFQLNGGRRRGTDAESRSTAASNPDRRGSWTDDTFHTA